MNSPSSKFAQSIIIATVFAVSANATPASTTAESDTQYQEAYNSERASQQRAEQAHHLELLKAGWRLAWQDKFNGSNIRDRKWSHEVSCWGGGNNERQCYTDRPDNSYVDRGILHIVAKEESFSGPGVPDDDPDYDPNDTSRTLPFTSARLRTKDKFDFKYGRVEVRAKVAGGQGMWPAIWMLPTDLAYGTWPSSGEIDIMEAVNLGIWANEVHGTLHYGLPWPQWENHGQTLEMDVNPADDYHVYAIEWEADEIRWYVDGKHYQTQTSAGWYNYIWQGQENGFQVANARAPYDQKFHLILNLAAGGDWPGTPDTGWTENREMLVDYVRVYQCKHRRGKREYTGAGCGTIDESVALNTDVGAPGINDFLLYKDGPETLNFDVDGATLANTLVPGYWELDEGTVFHSEVALGGDNGNVWDIMFNGVGNVFLRSADMSGVSEFDNGVSLSGGSGWTNNGELEFDIFVVEAAADSQLTVKLDSGWPNLGQVTIDMPAAGEWQHVTVKIANLLANPLPEGGGVDLSNVQNLFVLEHTGSNTHVQVDNIRLQCAVNTEPEDFQGDKTCEISPRIAFPTPEGPVLNVYEDAVTNWNLFDCCGGVSIAEINDGTGNVIEFTYDNDPGTNTVTFFQSAAALDLTAWAGGTMEFDMYVVSQPGNPAANPWIMKVDCVFPCSTGDVPLTDSNEGVLPATGVWQHYSFDLDALAARGLDLGQVDTPLVIFPAWGSQDGATFRIDNVQLIQAP